MIDKPTGDASQPGRVDFRALVDDPQFGNVDRVMAAVMAAARDRHGLSVTEASQVRLHVLGALAAHARPLAAAAAILIALSLAALRLPGTSPSPPPQQALATWVQSNHVPTNGELLTTFQGYGR